MAKGNILKEAIADAKAVREVALANAKSALEEAFTPKLQNMLSTKLAEDLDEDNYYDEDDRELDLGETNEEYIEDEGEEVSMDEEIDLEEILNELELEEGKKADNDDEEDLDEVHRPVYKADEVQLVNPKPEYVHGVNENKEFDLDSLLKEINKLEDLKPISETIDVKRKPIKRPKLFSNKPPFRLPNTTLKESKNSCKESKLEVKKLKESLRKTQLALNTVKGELNEVNLLNSKLLYVNRIFKANTLDDAQKLRVVETLDKADSTKEAKLIYETIKDTFKVANSKKVPNKKSTNTIKENIRGMASKPAGMSRTKKTAPKKAIISESDNMVSRFQKLANIKINE